MPANKQPTWMNMIKLSSDSFKVIIIIVMIVLISPFVINCFFAYPQTDDFTFSSVPRDMGFLNAQYHWYTEWTGRFTSCALFSINPLAYNSLAGYRVLLAILMVVQLASIYLLTDALTRKTLSWQEKLIFTLALLFAFLDQMNDVRSGLYWMAGVINYQFAETLLMAYFTLLLLVSEDRKHVSMGNKCLAIILAALLCGTNEIVLVLMLFIAAFITCHNYAARRNVSTFQLATIVAVAIGSCFALLAPGNFVRIHGYVERKNLLTTAWNAFETSMKSIGVWITSPLALILACMVFFAVISKPQLKTLFCNIKISNSACILLFLTFICFFIPYWATGMIPQDRVVNMIYHLFLIGWMITLAIAFAHLGKPAIQVIKKIPIGAGGLLLVVYMSALFSMGTSNFVLVTKDLLSGSSLRYSAEMQEKESELLESDEDACTVEDIVNTPPSLFFYFIGPDAEDWINRGYATYFGKKSVVLAKHEKVKAGMLPPDWLPDR